MKPYPLNLPQTEKSTRIISLCADFWGADAATVANQAFVSYEYANKTAPVWQSVPEKFGERSYESGSVNPSLWFSHSFNIERQMQNLKDRCGFGDDVNDGVNWAYAGSEVDGTTVLLIIGIMLFDYAVGISYNL